jgi:hypothetical protein
MLQCKSRYADKDDGDSKMPQARYATETLMIVDGDSMCISCQDPRITFTKCRAFDDLRLFQCRAVWPLPTAEIRVGSLDPQKCQNWVK